MRPRIAIGRSYKPLLTCRYPFVLVEGPRGTSKTRSILSILLARMLKWPGTRVLLCREFRAELTKTILTTLEDEVFPAFGMPVPGGAHRENRSEYVLPNKSTFFLAGLHEGSGALSMGMTFAYPAEVLQMSEKQVTDIAGCLRWMRSPEQPTLPDFTQLICDENPGAPGHWANQKAEPVDNSLRIVRTREDYERLQVHNMTPPLDEVGRWKRIITKVQDNPGYWDHKVWGYKDLGRHYLTKTLGTLTGYQRSRWIDGLHVAAEGTVYPEFDEDIHKVIDVFDIPASWPIYVGWDPGFDHPTAILWFAVSRAGTIYIIDEIYEGGKSVAAHCESVHKRNADRTIRGYYGDPQHCFSKTAQAPKSISEQASEAEYPIIMEPWPRTGGNEETMVNAVRQLLIDQQIYVFANCVNTIGEFQSWSFKRTSAGDPPPGNDRYEDKNNHAMDAVKGVVAAGVRTMTPAPDRSRDTPAKPEDPLYPGLA